MRRTTLRMGPRSRCTTTATSATALNLARVRSFSSRVLLLCTTERVFFSLKRPAESEFGLICRFYAHGPPAGHTVESFSPLVGGCCRVAAGGMGRAVNHVGVPARECAALCTGNVSCTGYETYQGNCTANPDVIFGDPLPPPLSLSLATRRPTHVTSHFLLS